MRGIPSKQAPVGMPSLKLLEQVDFIAVLPPQTSLDNTRETAETHPCLH